MTNIAIKKFFAHQREVTARQNAYYARLEEEMNNPPVTVEDTAAFDKEVEHFDFLLKRNWFLDEESIADFLMDASEEVFQEIVNRLKTYPYDVQQAIFAFLPLPIGNVKLKVRDLSDEYMAIREIQAYEAVKKTLDDSWQKYKTENNIEPPVGYLDSEMDDMYGELQATKKELEDVKKKSLSGRYVPPGMRDKVVSDDPRVAEVLKNIEKLENEINTQKKYIEQERDVWYANKRTEFEKQQMLSL
jgi:hypothetical protein